MGNNTVAPGESLAMKKSIAALTDTYQPANTYQLLVHLSEPEGIDRWFC